MQLQMLQVKKDIVKVSKNILFIFLLAEAVTNQKSHDSPEELPVI